MEEIFPGVYRRKDRLYTENLVPGETVYGESTVTEDGTEYRSWSPSRSKAAAALKKGLREFPVERSSEVLYLGASTGTTVSHFSDIASSGVVYAVEHSPKIARQLLESMEERGNVAPILADARKPEEYSAQVSKVDLLYQDVAQQDQVDILKRNAEKFLLEGGHAMIAVKARSISASRDPDDVFDEVKEGLRESFEILDGKKLSPFHEDHLFLVLQHL
ncbi:MAG: fibrillarin-like rRNA/tRNA 2'-O-methyltransferase [Candidatus Nanohaloarchaea archaeon]|nr:fibrillarin-like rRNA/tRNA 2'-O-methyltransferase [Candidatus Nanohaloarchaea archaeon]